MSQFDCLHNINKLLKYLKTVGFYFHNHVSQNMMWYEVLVWMEVILSVFRENILGMLGIPGGEVIFCTVDNDG